MNTPDYFTRYNNFAFERTTDGVLTLRFHTDGGPMTFTGQTHEDLAVLQRLLSLPMPVVGVANGTATVHSEYLLLSDVHIASERATYGDVPHPAFGLTAGDALQVVWEEAVGAARTKWLLWIGETIDAATAERWGVVNEVVPHDQAYARGLEIARMLRANPRLPWPSRFREDA